MVAMNSMPQHEVANGRGHMEFFLAIPTTFSREVAKKPSPVCPSGSWTLLMPRSEKSF
jgi:hypothetical protein